MIIDCKECCKYISLRVIRILLTHGDIPAILGDIIRGNWMLTGLGAGGIIKPYHEVFMISRSIIRCLTHKKNYFLQIDKRQVPCFAIE